MTRVLIVQPYVPSYRVPLFQGLRAELASRGFELAIAAGRPQGPARLREDASECEQVDFVLGERHVRLGPRTINMRSLADVTATVRPHLVIVEQAIKNLESYPLLVRHVLGRGARLAMWGQGRSYSVPQTRVESALKQWVTRRADWFFAYTEAGARYVTDRGFDPARTTVLGNTIDTSGLQADLAGIADADRVEFMQKHRLTKGRTAIFLGGVDRHKGIDFLLESAVRVEQEVPGFVLLVGGSGAQADRVRELQDRGGPVRFLGRLDGVAKALALSASEVMLIPEWVGLVAVDSLAAGCPIITTEHASHSPEFEYLESGRNAIVSAHDTARYSREVARILGSSEELARLQRTALEDSKAHDMRGMITRFADGIERWRGSRRH